MTQDQLINLAIQKHQAGQLADAERLYRQILSQNPHNAGALNLLGVLASQTGQHQAGAELIARAVAIDPKQAEFHGNLGLALWELKRVDDAIACYRRAIALKPDFAQAYNNLGNALNELGQVDQAMNCYQRAAVLDPGYPQTWYNMANVQKNRGHLEEAAVAYQRTLALKPDWREAQNNLGNTLCSLGSYDEAEAIYRKALTDRPNDALAHWNIGLLRLRRGDLEGGWPEYEWRWQLKELNLRAQNLAQPHWDGQDLNGKRIFLYSEQGFGDTIQFIRYIPEVLRRGGQIVAGCQPELLTSLRGLYGIQDWVTTGDPLPNFDVQCTLPSLPGVLRTTLATIPAGIPYLSADPARKSQWQTRLASLPGRKIGLCWAGRPTHSHDRYRTMTLEQFKPLADPAHSLISLQKGDAAAQTRSASFPITDWTADLTDFADTAALIDALDLVITVDTAVAHLAGAVGKPVWMLLHFFPDWRWMLERTDSPWYPTMRLFRQERLGDWDPPISRAAQALRE